MMMLKPTISMNTVRKMSPRVRRWVEAAGADMSPKMGHLPTCANKTAACEGWSAGGR